MEEVGKIKPRAVSKPTSSATPLDFTRGALDARGFLYKAESFLHGAINRAATRFY